MSGAGLPSSISFENLSNRLAQDSQKNLRIASLDQLPQGFQRIGEKIVKDAHSLWELRPAEDEQGGYVLLRLEEERAVDMRHDASQEKKPEVKPAFVVGQRVAAIHKGQLQNAEVKDVHEEIVTLDFGGGMPGQQQQMPSSMIYEEIQDDMNTVIQEGVNLDVPPMHDPFDVAIEPSSKADGLADGAHDTLPSQALGGVPPLSQPMPGAGVPTVAPTGGNAPIITVVVAQVQPEEDDDEQGYNSLPGGQGITVGDPHPPLNFQQPGTESTFSSAPDATRYVNQDPLEDNRNDGTRGMPGPAVPMGPMLTDQQLSQIYGTGKGQIPEWQNLRTQPSGISAQPGSGAMPSNPSATYPPQEGTVSMKPPKKGSVWARIAKEEGTWLVDQVARGSLFQRLADGPKPMGTCPCGVKDVQENFSARGWCEACEAEADYKQQSLALENNRRGSVWNRLSSKNEPEVSALRPFGQGPSASLFQRIGSIQILTDVLGEALAEVGGSPRDRMQALRALVEFRDLVSKGEAESKYPPKIIDLALATAQKIGEEEWTTVTNRGGGGLPHVPYHQDTPSWEQENALTHQDDQVPLAEVLEEVPQKDLELPADDPRIPDSYVVITRGRGKARSYVRVPPGTRVYNKERPAGHAKVLRQAPGNRVVVELTNGEEAVWTIASTVQTRGRGFGKAPFAEGHVVERGPVVRGRPPKARTAEQEEDLLEEEDEEEPELSELGDKAPDRRRVPAEEFGLTPGGGVDNILKVMAAATPEEIEYWSKWYYQAHDDAQIMAKKYDKSVEVVAGIIAVLSPNLKWQANLNAAEKVVAGDVELPESKGPSTRVNLLSSEDEYVESLNKMKLPPELRDEKWGKLPLHLQKALKPHMKIHPEKDGIDQPSWDPHKLYPRKRVDDKYLVPSKKRKSESLFSRIAVAGIPSYEANVKKALQILETNDVSKLAAGRWGGKVRAFYESIANPFETARRIVLDGHAINIWRGEKAGLANSSKMLPKMRQPSPQSKAEMKNDYQRAADILKLTPQAVQAVTWMLWRAAEWSKDEE